MTLFSYYFRILNYIKILAYLSCRGKYILALMVFFVSAYANAQCSEELFQKTEKKYGIPNGLLRAISYNESSINPYALNIQGTAFYGNSGVEAYREINKHLAKGITSIDIGCMQLNYKYHNSNFKNITQMLDPTHNIDYGGKFLRSLYDRTGKWHKAVHLYHSSDNRRGKEYSRKILNIWKNTKRSTV